MVPSTSMRLADIAAHAGVSEATVSRVLNGKPSVAVSTRQAVLTALDVLGYERPARLQQRRAGLIGLIIPELSSPIFPGFAQTIGTALAMAGYTAVLCTQTPGGITGDDYTELLLERSVAGIIFVNGLIEDTLFTLEGGAAAAQSLLYRPELVVRRSIAPAPR